MGSENYAALGLITDHSISDHVNACTQCTGAASVVLGFIEVISSILLAIFLIVGIALSKYEHVAIEVETAYTLALVGVTCFVIPAILCGAFAIAAGRTKSNCLIITTMVFAILNASLVVPYVIVVGVALILEGEALEQSVVVDQTADAIVLMGGLILVVGVVQLVVTILMSVLACRGTCCKPYQREIHHSTPIDIEIVAVDMTSGNGEGPRQLQTYGYDQFNI